MSESKKLRVAALLAVFIVFVFVGTAVFYPLPEAKGGWVYIKEQPSVVISPFPVPYKRKVAVSIAGSGFEPKQEISLQIVMGGVPSDISFIVKPRPIANEFGAFFSIWTIDSEIRTKLLEPTAYTLKVVDENGFVLAHAPLVFAPEKKEPEKKE